MHTRTSATAAAASLLLAACSQATPRRRGIPGAVGPRIKSGAGSERSAAGAKSKGDREAARAAARTVPGVRSVAWVDRSNLLVRGDTNARRPCWDAGAADIADKAP